MVGRELKIFLIIAIVGAIVGAGIVVAVKLPQQIAAREEKEAREEKLARQEMEVDLTDLMFPAEFQEIWKTAWYPYRPRMERWTEEQAERFWIEPEEVGIEYLAHKNEMLIQGLLENVPE
jgi:hypothetical protein